MKKSLGFFCFLIYSLAKNTLIYHHHGKAVFVFVLGLLLDSSNPAKKRRESEILVFIEYLFLSWLYRNSGKAMLTFCRAWQPCFKLAFCFWLSRPSLGGKTPREHLFLHGLI